MNWLYLVDHPFRDLPAYCWWAHQSKLNCTSEDKIFLAATTELSFQDIIEAKIDVIVWHYARPNNMHLLKRAKALGIKNIVHDTEGIPYRMESYFANLTKTCFSFIDEIWLWGESQYCHMREHLKALAVNNVKLIITGSIRYEYIKSLPKVDLRCNKDSFLWNTNFSYISPLYQHPWIEFEQLYKIHKVCTPSEALSKVIWFSHLRSTASVFIKDWLDNSALTTFVMRPHPFESTAFYRSFFDQASSRISYSSGGDVQNDIDSASAVFHSGCQTCLDAFIRGVPSFVFQNHYDNVWAKVSLQISECNLDNFNSHEYLEQCLGKQSSLFKEHCVDEFLYNLDNSIDLSEAFPISSFSSLPLVNSVAWRMFLLNLHKLKCFPFKIFSYAINLILNLKIKPVSNPKSSLKAKMSANQIAAHLHSDYDCSIKFVGKLVYF